MSLYIPSGAANVVMSWSIPGDAGPALTAFGVTDVQTVSAQDIADEVMEAYVESGSIRAVMNQAVALSSVTSYKNIGGDVIELGFWSGNLPAQGAGFMAPPQVTWLLHKLTGIGGRKQRGRMFLPGVGEGAVSDGGFIETTALTNMQAGADTFLAYIGTNVGPMTVLHSDPADFLWPVQDLQVAPKVATQRRRLR